MGDIIDTIEQAGSLEKLVAGFRATGLDVLLQGAGPYTVFAPADEAFSKLAPGTFATLLTNVASLKSILSGYIVPGKIMVKDMMKMEDIQSIDGQKLTIKNTNTFTIDDARIVQADVNCSNGIIHIIDSVNIAR